MAILAARVTTSPFTLVALFPNNWLSELTPGYFLLLIFYFIIYLKYLTTIVLRHCTLSFKPQGQHNVKRIKNVLKSAFG